MATKKAKINEKTEELPSFLLNIKTDGEKIKLKSKKSAYDVGPIFFGCHQQHPRPHLLNLSSFHHTQYTASSRESILANAFLPKTVAMKTYETKKLFHPVMKTRQVFPDPYPHRCLGNLKVFKPEVTPPVIKLGKTVSVIEAETVREIQLCWIKRVSSRSRAKVEWMSPSDIWERKRPFLTYKERIAHTHFPKEFVEVRVLGPTIPASITIIKLPSKRKTDSEIDLHLTKKRKSKEEDERKKIKKVEMQPEKSSEESAVATDEVFQTEELELGNTEDDEEHLEVAQGDDEEHLEVAQGDDEEEIYSRESLSEDEEVKAKKEKSVSEAGIIAESLEEREEDGVEENLDKEKPGTESIDEEKRGAENSSEEPPEG